MIDFKSTYNRDEILDFLRNSFIKDFQKDIRKVDIPEQKHIQEAYFLGSSSKLELSVFEFLHQGSTEKRVSLTKEAFNVLRDSGNFKAIGIFHSKDTDDWRFSFMTATPVVNEKGKVRTILSNPKRYSFLLGPNAKVNTPTKFLITRGEIQSFEDLKERFSIEVVNKEFYKEISKLFIQLVGGTLGKGKSKEVYKALLRLPGVKESSQTAQEFAVRLIGRIIFCWFLREKKNGSEESLMPHSLLSLEASKNHKNYYHDVLEPIFFKVLNVPLNSRKDEKFFSDPYDKIPYLNGGLFSPHDDDFYSINDSKQEKNNEEVIVPDRWLQGLFEILETYNFTIDENSAFDEELSIDPEMLGRIFENLLAEINPETGESARKGTGSYYTPRVIVDYMVDESLYLYLKNKTDIEEDKLRSLISYDLDDDSDTPLTEEEKEKIISAIDELKILDPACGSGAFPMGALQKIVFILQQLDPNGQYWFKAQLKGSSPELQRKLERENKEKNFDYIRKLGVIRKNIFGVDIQPIATEISRLRCFLTLVVDQKVDDDDDNRGIDPLPNLDFKFVTANSLIPLPEKEKNGQSDWLEDQSGIEELMELREEFFHADISEKDSLIGKFAIIQRNMALRNSKDTVGDYTKCLTEWDPFSHNTTPWFDSEWMFGIKEGFNIVLGNPPYIKVQEIESKYKVNFKKNYKSAEGSYDIYILFNELGLELLAKDGVLTFIQPNKFFNSDYGRVIRDILTSKRYLYQIVDFGDNQNFSAAITYTCILICQKKKQSTFKYIQYFENGLDSIENLKDEDSRGLIFTLNSSDYNKDSWIFGNPEEIQLINKLKENMTLGDFVTDIFQGVVTSADTVYILEKKGNKYYSKFLDTEINLEDNFVKPLLRGKDVKRYRPPFATSVLIFPYEEGELIKEREFAILYPMTWNYLKKCESKLRSRENGKMNNESGWYGYVYPKNLELFESDKILTQVLAKKASMMLDTKGNYFVGGGNAGVYGITIRNNLEFDINYLLGLLNSRLLDFYLRKISSKFQNGYFSYAKRYIQLLPIKVSSEKNRLLISNYVNKIISMRNLNTSDNRGICRLEAELDYLIYQLYGLTKEEIELVENSTNT